MTVTIHQLQRTPWRLVNAAANWHVASQQQARRNALVASTALTARRQEQRDVDDFLAELEARRSTPALPAQRSATHPA
jgi:hypothetical protein